MGGRRQISIYGKDGKTIIGWTVEAGEGPTQIAGKLNFFYSCDMSCEISFDDIVRDNPEAFANVFDKNGNPEELAFEISF